MTYIKGALAVRVYLCFAAAYLLSYAFRSVNAVIAPALQDDAGLSNSDLGLLSAAYFLTFACMQLPLGIWLDKYGPRRVEAVLLLFAAAGAAVFAMSSSLVGLWLGRALIGIGVSACLMAAYKAYRLWFAPERQSQMASLMLVAGTAGALISTVPVSAAMPLIGWRGVFWIMGALVILAAAAIFFMLKKVEAEHPASLSRPAAAASVAQQSGQHGGYASIFGNAYFRRMGLLAMINSGSFNALQTLWAGPWMMTILGMSREQTAQILFTFNLCLMLSYLSLSWWAPRYISHDGKRGWPPTRIIALGLSGAIAIQGMMLLISAPWAWVLWILLTAFITVTTLAQTSVSLSFPSALAGRANSAYNLLIFTGAFVMQWGIGLLIDMFKMTGLSSSDSMRSALALCVALQTVSLIAFLMNRARPQTS
jgi:MFS family permease